MTIECGRGAVRRQISNAQGRHYWRRLLYSSLNKRIFLHMGVTSVSPDGALLADNIPHTDHVLPGVLSYDEQALGLVADVREEELVS